MDATPGWPSSRPAELSDLSLDVAELLLVSAPGLEQARQAHVGFDLLDRLDEARAQRVQLPILFFDPDVTRTEGVDDPRELVQPVRRVPAAVDCDLTADLGQPLGRRVELAGVLVEAAEDRDQNEEVEKDEDDEGGPAQLLIATQLDQVVT
jgi:hypothetical protein